MQEDLEPIDEVIFSDAYLGNPNLKSQYLLIYKKSKL